MSAHAKKQRRVSTDDVYRLISDKIKQSGDKQVPISSQDLAQELNVASSTIDYHIRKLLEQGRLLLSKRRGRFNVKYYMLPTSEKMVFYPHERANYREFLKQKLRENEKLLSQIHAQDEEHKSHTKKDEDNALEDQKDQFETKVEVDLPADTEEKSESLSEKKPMPSVSVDESIPDFPDKRDQLVVSELTLDEAIERYLQQSKSVASADMLLSHKDREILSVMNETLGQTIVYLKDLSEQLSTIQNKTLIQKLIDERNDNQARIKNLEEEIDLLRHQLQETNNKKTIDPNRVRMMHQLLISTIDNYLDQPNHALALGRKNFRNMISEQISNLVRYVLNLE